MSGASRILRLAWRLPAGELRERLKQSVRRQSGRVDHERAAGLVRQNRELLLQQDIAGIETASIYMIVIPVSESPAAIAAWMGAATAILWKK